MKNKFLIMISLITATLLSSCGSKTYSYKDYEINMDMDSDNFKIMQLTDIHIGVTTDFKYATKILKTNIRECNPDLIVITGDTFMEATSGIVTSTLDFFNSFNIPFAFTYGNHDLQGLYDRYFINDYLSTLKNAKFIDYKDDDLAGLTNYYINLKSNNSIIYRLFITDSNSNNIIDGSIVYDGFHEEQIKQIETIQKTDNVKSLLFYHIPLYEYVEAYELYEEGKIEGQGENRESSWDQPKTDYFTRLKNSNVVGYFCGHDHINYSDLLYEDCVLSYGVKSSTELYHDDDLIGYKKITLTKDGSFSLENVRSIIKGVNDYE
ncbi:MAG: metallophosphoesterase [Bacilli bacterium]